MTTKNKTLSRILTLTLTFVLVFTGMGIGSWGVDKVWATGIDLGIDDIVKGGGQLIGTCDIDPYEDDDISVYDVYLKSIKAYADMISISSKEWYLSLIHILSHISIRRFSISKQRGALISSRLIPPKLLDMR